MLDLEQHLLRQMAFSRATFGPGARNAGVVDHIRKELEEVQRALEGREDHDPAKWDAAREWVDVVILALDGLTRQIRDITGFRDAPEEAARTACRMILEKQARNETRDWPDWRSAPKDKAIEHIRS